MLEHRTGYNMTIKKNKTQQPISCIDAAHLIPLYRVYQKNATQRNAYQNSFYVMGVKKIISVG